MPSSKNKIEKTRLVHAIFLIALPLALMIVPAVFAGSDAKTDAKKVILSKDKRFIDNGDQTITDTKTRLMWTKEDSYQQTGHWLNWFESFEFVEKLNEDGFANHRDWKMPTIDQLKTLYDPHKTNSSQLGHGMKIHIDPIFAKNGSGSHWSLQADGAFNALGVIFNHGGKFTLSKKARARKSARALRHVSP